MAYKYATCDRGFSMQAMTVTTDSALVLTKSGLDIRYVHRVNGKVGEKQNKT